MLVYQHLSTQDSREKAIIVVRDMWAGLWLPNSWIGMYKEQGSWVSAYEFVEHTADEFMYTSPDPSFELIGTARAISPDRRWFNILWCRNYATGGEFYSVVKYRGFATRVGDNRFRVY